jgi:2-keto-3-deoxy-L-rhamnonate aldolase RhmA
MGASTRSLQTGEDSLVAVVIKANVAIIDTWRAKVQAHAVRLLNATGYDWLVDLENKCKEACCKVVLEQGRTY